MLDGQGADELLGGYPYFRGARLASLSIKQAKVVGSAAILFSAFRTGRGCRGSRFSNMPAIISFHPW